MGKPCYSHSHSNVAWQNPSTVYIGKTPQHLMAEPHRWQNSSASQGKIPQHKANTLSATSNCLSTLLQPVPRLHPYRQPLKDHANTSQQHCTVSCCAIKSATHWYIVTAILTLVIGEHFTQMHFHCIPLLLRYAICVLTLMRRLAESRSLHIQGCFAHTHDSDHSE